MIQQAEKHTGQRTKYHNGEDTKHSEERDHLSEVL